MTITNLNLLTESEAKTQYGGISKSMDIHFGQTCFATAAEAVTGTDKEKLVNPPALVGMLSGALETLTGTALGTTRKIRGEYTLSATGIASGNAVGVRGAITLSGTVTGGAYLYGAQGKLIVSGTMNHADSRLCAMIAQLDTTGATLTTGQLSALWVDHGAGVTGDGGGQFNMIRITNTVAGSKPNAVIYAHSNATYLLDLSAPGGTMDWIAAAGTSAGSAGEAGGCAAPSVLIVNVGGTPYYVPVFDQNT